MDRARHLILGAGVSGLATAASLGGDDFLVLEKEDEIGGYCRTVKRDGFTWDYSGHYFHFRHPEIESWLRQRMPGQTIRTVQRRSFVRYRERLIDFPFQKNIHQLDRDDFIDCLVDLHEATDPARAPAPQESFRDMLYARFGRGIADRFLVPYNEKLYACDLSSLDKDAMGRFFPHADLGDVIRNMRPRAATEAAQQATYNATFTYPEGGAIEYVRALAREVPDGRISLGEVALSIDVERRVVTTNRRQIGYQHLITSAPFPSLLRLTETAHDPALYAWNKVLVFNFGFDAKGDEVAHWIYYPDPSVSFYRVGHYDNIFDSDRMSLYVEVAFARDVLLDETTIAAVRATVLRDLERMSVVTTQRLVAEHHVVLDPAYVHITGPSQREHARLSAILREHGVHSIGRYGAWTYCSIEDNIVEARALARELTAG